MHSSTFIVFEVQPTTKTAPPDGSILVICYKRHVHM